MVIRIFNLENTLFLRVSYQTRKYFFHLLLRDWERLNCCISLVVFYLTELLNLASRIDCCLLLQSLEKSTICCSCFLPQSYNNSSILKLAQGVKEKTLCLWMYKHKMKLWPNTTILHKLSSFKNQVLICIYLSIINFSPCLYYCSNQQCFNCTFKLLSIVCWFL